MHKSLWKLILLDFLVTLSTKRPAAVSSPGKSDVVRLCLQVQMTTGILHGLFNATEAVTQLIKGEGFPVFPLRPAIKAQDL